MKTVFYGKLYRISTECSKKYSIFNKKAITKSSLCNEHFQLIKPLFLGVFKPPSLIPLKNMHQELVEVYEMITRCHSVAFQLNYFILLMRENNLFFHVGKLSKTSVFSSLFIYTVIIYFCINFFIWYIFFF